MLFCFAVVTVSKAEWQVLLCLSTLRLYVTPIAGDNYTDSLPYPCVPFWTFDTMGQLLHTSEPWHSCDYHAANRYTLCSYVPYTHVKCPLALSHSRTLAHGSHCDALVP